MEGRSEVGCLWGRRLDVKKKSRDDIAFSGSTNPIVQDAILRLCIDLCSIVTPRDFAKMISDTYLHAALLSFIGFRQFVSLH